jgi:DNA-binding NarL/FixJ family response regulator
MSLSARVPVVGGLAYIERIRQLPPTFTVTLAVESDNRYFRHAIRVSADAGKVGYVAPEVATSYYDTIKTAAAPITCPARRGSPSDHETSGVELLLDMTGIPVSDSE